MMDTDVTFRITVPHDKGVGFHMWMFPCGYKGVGPTERRDRRGYRQGKRSGYYPPWLVLMCNNTDCPAQAVVPVRFVIDHADDNDDMVREWSLW